MVAPFNMAVMDVGKFIKEHGLLEVTTTALKEPSTNEFHPDGLFSEEIFGRIGTLERMTTLGYIELKMKMVAPVLYKTLARLGGFYTDLMAGRVYATWDAEKADFERVFGDPEDTPNCNTGFHYFVKYFPQIKFKLTESLTRETRVDLLNEYRSIGLYKQYLVQPAGMRDVQDDGTGRLIQDDINKLYISLMSYAGSLPDETTSPLYDGLKFNIQSTGVRIYEYLENLMTGKRGFAQGVLAARKIAMGTRNVITAASYVARNPDDPQVLKPDETISGVYQTAKAFQPLVFFHLKTIFFQNVFGEEGSSYNVPLINPKTFKLEYHEINEDERLKWVSPDGINSAINRFVNLDVRSRPLVVRDVNNAPYYMYLVYDDVDKITLCRSIDELTNTGVRVDKSKLRPITWIEALYIAVYFAVDHKFAHITRYPVLGDGSVYPSRIHLCSTIPGRVVEMVDIEEPDKPLVQFPEYPILGNAYQDTIQIDFGRLAGLGADYDGDTVSFNGVMSEEANEECERYMRSTRSLVDTQQNLVMGDISDTAAIAIYNWTF